MTSYEEQPKHPRVMALVGVYPTEADARKHMPIAADLPYRGIWIMPEPTRARMHVFTTAADGQLEADGMERESRYAGVTSYEEWRVTGTDHSGEPYEFTWSKLRNPHLGEPEAAAAAFIAANARHKAIWRDGLHLSRRTVTVTDWEEAQ